MESQHYEPEGRLILRTLAMPADTNPNGDIFGGWIMSQMDMAGGIMAKEIARTRTVTVAVDSIQFIKPVHVGDIVGCYGKVMNIGTTSITINLEVWVEYVRHAKNESERQFKVTEAAFTYVSLGEDGKKHPINKEGLTLPEK